MTQEFTADYSKWLEYLDQLGYRKVVLCKDCANYRHIDCPFEWTGGRPKPDMYCAWAERRTSCDE